MLQMTIIYGMSVYGNPDLELCRENISGGVLGRGAVSAKLMDRV
jgi:hypothetical protein